MKLVHPSREFDETVAAICHGTASDEQLRELNQLLRRDPRARDEYVLRLELHSRLASAPDLFAVEEQDRVIPSGIVPAEKQVRRRRDMRWAMALAASFALLAIGWWVRHPARPAERRGSTSKAVAMLNRVAEAVWDGQGEPPRSGTPLEPRSLRLNSGLAQIVFYSGARVVIEGPAEIRLVSPDEMECRKGRLVAEVPPPAKGFRLRTPDLHATDLGTVFGVMVDRQETELHVFTGLVEIQNPSGTGKQKLPEGRAAVATLGGPARLVAANRTGFTSLFDLQNRSLDADVLRHEHWRATSSRLDEDPSLLVHFDFETGNGPAWRLPNTSRRADAAPDAAIVGCQWSEGRWPDKRALEFRGVSDRVRFEVEGEFESLTLAAWVRVQGLDRQINSLFMSDGFDPGTIHWSIRDDGVLGLTVIGPGAGRFQIVATPPVLTLDQFGLWLHLAAVVDGPGGRVVQFVNGTPVGAKALKASQSFRIGAAELGNWNARGFPSEDPFHIRNFSGAMDDFTLFSRALSADEVRELYASGKPQSDPPPRFKP